MQTCPNCNFSNRAGVLFCENCGASLIGNAPLSTRNFVNKPAEEAVPELIGTINSAGTDVFGQSTLLRIEVEGGEPLMLKPQQEIVFGRRDPATGAIPDVDLTPFAGYRMGVSRRHAAIRRSDNDRLDLWDLGSSNGTFLNGNRLLPHRPNKLHDGDEIRFGQMLLKIFFQPVTEKTNIYHPTPAPKPPTATPTNAQANQVGGGTNMLGESGSNPAPNLSSKPVLPNIPPVTRTDFPKPPSVPAQPASPALSSPAPKPAVEKATSPASQPAPQPASQPASQPNATNVGNAANPPASNPAPKVNSNPQPNATNAGNAANPPAGNSAPKVNSNPQPNATNTGNAANPPAGNSAPKVNSN